MDFPQLLRALANAVEAADGNALADCFTPNGVYEDYFFGRKEGRQGIREMLAHFHEGGKDFRWEFFDPVCDGCRGYARYRFSYDSLRPEACGNRVGFDGISCIDLQDDLISQYREVFDRGMALAQQNFAPEHIFCIEVKHAKALRLSLDWQQHFLP
ncbi:MAG: nuclear transport factor 2 family protein [Proteobacteria bacterium]|nr:nuclear transport factor 2 family protein [Pseudomonadota bacterium]